MCNESAMNENNKEQCPSGVNKDGLPEKETDAALKPVPFDEALSAATFGKFNYFVIFISGVIITYSFTETISISYVLPISRCDMNLSSVEKGVVGAIAFLGAIASSPFSGFLSDTIGRRKVLMPSIFLAFILSGLSSFVGKYWLLVVFRFFVGFFGAGVAAVIFAYVSEVHNNKHRARAIMASSVIFGILFAALPLLAWAIINQSWSLPIPFLGIAYKPWRLFLIACSIPGFICAACFLILPESPKFLLSRGREKEAIEAIQRIYSLNTGKKPEELKIFSLKLEEDEDNHVMAVFDKKHPIKSVFESLRNQTAPLLKKEYFKKLVLACVIQFGILANSNGMYVWFPGILNEVVQFINSGSGNRTTLCEILSSNIEAAKHFEDVTDCNENLELSTYLYSMGLEVMYILGYALIGFVINAAGPIPIVFVVLVACGASGVSVAVVNIPLVAVFLFMSLLLSGLCYTVVNAATVDLFPTYYRSMAVCLSMMVGKMGALTGSNVLGLLVENHCEMSFILSGACLIVCGCLALLIPNPKKASQEKRKNSVITMTGIYVKNNTES